MSSNQSRRIVSTLCAAQMLSLSAFAMFPALQPLLRTEWRLSNTAAGSISGTYYLGYMLAVPVLTGLTDRVDARRVWLMAASVSAVAAIAFGALAQGLWTAIAFQFLAGVGLAGTYMPGLRILADSVEGHYQARFISFYTTSFTIGSSSSFYLLGAAADLTGWRSAVLIAALGPMLASLLVATFVQARRDAPAFQWNALAAVDLRPAYRSTASMRYVYAYMAHMWELFALRAWLVPFLTFVQALQAAPRSVRPTTVAAFIALLGVPASIAGNELSTHLGRGRVIPIVMAVSLLLSVAVGLASPLPFWVVVAACCAYGVMINGDSAALTSGLVATAPPAVRGATMALYSMLGFAAAFAGSLAVGGVLDVLGGQSIGAWLVAFAAMGLPNVLGALVIRRAATAEKSRAILAES